MACSLATLILLVPGNLLTFLTTSALGISRQSVVASAAGAMLKDGWPFLALAIMLFAVVFPLVRFALLIVVLVMVERQNIRPWLGRAFRRADQLETWAMPDVFLLGLAVAYARLADSISVHLGMGAICHILAGVLLKLGGYGFLRFLLPMFPEASAQLAWLVLGLSAVAVIYTSLVALVQSDM
ncbi:MAG: hypothetical protein EOO80_17685, partial [Oxalobacteraceae bacterium]